MSSPVYHTLLIEDDVGDRDYIREILSFEPDHPFQLEYEESLQRGLQRIAKGNWQLILLDLNLPDSSGLETFAKIREETKDIPVIVMTGFDDATMALKAMRQGAQDYLVKGMFDGPLLIRAMQYAIERNRLFMELQDALKTVRTLQGMIPICANCKRIRDDAGFWQSVEAYIEEHSDASFSHGICPECIDELYPNLKKKKKENGPT